jgi:NAD(P)-dependent dehydrogenase (short-subunit alcohol dehydrogenase family)
MTELLDGKTAIIYGGGGGIGGGVARTFAREGARVFLAGRTMEKLDAVAKDIRSAGGSAEAAVVDALDEQAVDDHVRDVVSRAGRVEMIAGMAALRRAPRLADVAEVAAFLASDRAAGMTGTMANVTSGLVLR